MKKRKKIKQTIQGWLFQHRYPIFLSSLLLFFILPNILKTLFGVEMRFMTAFAIVVFASVFLVRYSRRGFRIIVSLTALLVILVVVASEHNMVRNLNLILFFLLGIYFFFITVFLFKDLLTLETVTWQVIVGAFTGYFMIGVMGFFLLSFIEMESPGSFTVEIHSLKDINDIFYFAFITLTTIGYGDITPVSSSARSAVVLIGLVGQFYLAIVMAIMVGKFLSTQRNSTSPPDQRNETDKTAL